MIAYILLSYVFMFVYAVCITCVDTDNSMAAAKMFVFAPIAAPFAVVFIFCDFIAWIFGD